MAKQGSKKLNETKKEGIIKMRKINKKNILKSVALGLIMAIIVGAIVNENLIKSKASENGNIDFGTVYAEETVDGITYTVSKRNDIDGSESIYVRKSNTNDFTRLEVRDDSIAKETYTYQVGHINNLYSYECEKEVFDTNLEEIDINDIASDTRGIIFNSAVKTRKDLGIQYWYKKGNEGKKIYYRIGCKAKYQIRVDNNSNAKKACEKLASEIKKSNAKYDEGEAFLVGTGVSVGAIIGLVIANYLLPITVIVDIIVGIIGAIATGGTFTKGVAALVSSYKHYLNVKDIYVDARSYGEVYK